MSERQPREQQKPRKSYNVVRVTREELEEIKRRNLERGLVYCETNHPRGRAYWWEKGEL